MGAEGYNKWPSYYNKLNNPSFDICFFISNIFKRFQTRIIGLEPIPLASGQMLPPTPITLIFAIANFGVVRTPLKLVCT
jgi:hypothetical protein